MPERLEQAPQAHIPPNVFNRQLSLSNVRKMQTAIRAATATPSAMPPLGNYSFVTINIPNSTNGAYPGGINDEGVLVGTYNDSNYAAHGFVWENGNVETLDYPGASPASGTNLLGINNRGVVIGYYYDSSFNPHGVTYSLNLSTWGTLPDIPNYAGVEPFGINDDGVAVGNAYAYNSVGPLSWIWHPESQSYSFFSVPGAQEASTFPSGINDQQQIVGGFESWNNLASTHSFIRERCADEDYQDTDTSCSYQQINVPGTLLSTYAIGLNNRGAIVGYFFAVNEYGFVRSPAGEFKTVSAPGGVNGTSAFGINDHGVLCGSFTNSAFQVIGFVAYPE